MNVIIPAAGFSSRLYPLTQFRQKCLLSIHGKPIIKRILENFGPHDNVIVVIQKEDKILADYLTNNCKQWRITIRRSSTYSVDGPAETIAYAATVLDADRPTIVWLSDTVLEPTGVDLREVIDHFVVVPLTGDMRPSDWCIWADGQFHNKSPAEHPGAKALIGIYGFSNTVKLIDSLSMTGPEISDILKTYGGMSSRELHRHRWVDTGDINSFYSNGITPQHGVKPTRLEIVDKYLVRKSYEDPMELTAQARWYEHAAVDRQVAKKLPKIYGVGKNYIDMERIPGQPLNELIVHNKCSPQFITYVVRDMISLVVGFREDRCYDKRKIEELTENTKIMIVGKTEERLKRTNITPDKARAIKGYAEIVHDKILQKNEWTLMHGDFHTGNVLFDMDNGALRLIDPRGIWGGMITPYGSYLYDLGKLFHDLYWNYSGLQQDVTMTDHRTIIEREVEAAFSGDDRKTAKMLGYILLATAIPFQNKNVSDRMTAFINGAENV
jgi:dTDP-glucose pyrophosphorylase